MCVDEPWLCLAQTERILEFHTSRQRGVAAQGLGQREALAVAYVHERVGPPSKHIDTQAQAQVQADSVWLTEEHAHARTYS